MAVYRKELAHLNGKRLYLVYPFYGKLTQEDFANTMRELYRLGIIPVIASTYLVQLEAHILDRRNIYNTISLCEGAILVHEEHLTRNMTIEIAYTKRIGLAVYTI